MITMPNKNIADAYDKLITVVTLISDDLEKGLPRFTEAEFLGIFGTEFQNQLSHAGKDVLAGVLEQNTLNPVPKTISEKFHKDYQATLEAFLEDFPKSFNPDASIKKAQCKLQEKLTITKDQLVAELTQELNVKGHNFTPKDKAKFETTFSEYLDKNYEELNKHFEKFKDLLAVYTKYQLHEELTEAQTKADKDISHSITRDPTLEELQTKPKPKPTFGFKVDKKNLAEQIQSDIAAGKDIDINITLSDLSAIFKRMADNGFQYQKPSLALVYMLIFLIIMYRHNNEIRAFQSTKDVIKEKKLFDFDPSKITLQMIIPTPNGNEKIIRKKGPFNPEQIKELQSLIDENKREFLKHHHSSQTNKKSGFTSTESGYNTEEEEEIPYSRPRP